MRDFLEEFKAKIAAIDTSGIEIMIPSAKPVVQREDPGLQRFNVHKRSLPPGSPPLDRIVFFNVSKTVGEWLVERIVKAKVYHDTVNDSKTLIYYDVVPVDATPRERSVYYNAKPLVAEEVPGFVVERWVD